MHMRRGSRLIAIGVSVVLVTIAGPVMPVTSLVGVAQAAERCNYDSPVSLQRTADDLLADIYHLGQHPAVKLPHDLTWREDPLGDRQWRQKLQMLRYVVALMYQWQATDDDRYRDRGIELMRSWIAANPYGSAASSSAWKDQVTAWRAMTMVCVAGLLPEKGWLEQAIADHGAILADPAFYVGGGNHALNQAIGLLDVGCYLGRTDWQRLAVRRIDRFIGRTIDTQGVSDEQAVKYDRYDYDRLMLARDHLLDCGLPAPANFHRVERIPVFLAQATRPDGRMETIGDSDDLRSRPIDGTPLEYAATFGERGTVPGQTVSLFDRGYAFGRTGWGDGARAFRDEIQFSLRYAAALLRHGHADAGGLTMSGNGAQLLVDPGYGDQNSSIWHRYFVSRAAHNLVTVDGVAAVTSRGGRLLRSKIRQRSVDLKVVIRSYPGVTLQRRVVFSRRMGYLIVEDTVISDTPRTSRQLWHLTEDARPKVDGSRTWTRRDRGNLFVRQLVGGGTTSVKAGRTSPIQGWISRSYGQREPAPVIEHRATGTRVRFLTLLAPFVEGTGSDRPPVGVIGLDKSATGFRMVVDIDGVRELVVATGTNVRITDAP
jgi:hypothetical protein